MIAKARRAPELILRIQIKEARFTFAAPLSFDVLLAVARAADRIAIGLIVGGAQFRAAAILAALCPEIIVILGALITFAASYARFALAFSLGVALQIARSLCIAIARDTVAVLAHKIVHFATLAIRTVTVRGAVQTMTTVAC